MKKALMMIASMIVGAAIGVGVAYIASAVMNDGAAASASAETVSTNNKWLIALYVLMSLAGLVIGVLLQTIGHEAGHLVGGLLTGFRFVSFRVGSLTLLRRNGRLIVRRFRIPGTGGQCLMAPPETDAEHVPYVVYNASGVIVNIVLAALAVLPIVTGSAGDCPFTTFILIFSALMGVLMAAMNGIPMKIGGIGNDGFNIRALRRSVNMRHIFIAQLRANAATQEGMRPRDWPDSWFDACRTADTASRDYNMLHATYDLMRASKAMDNGNADLTRDIMTAVKQSLTTLPDIVRKEIDCELAFCALATGRKSEAAELIDKDLRKYIDKSSTYSSPKMRLLCAIALHMEHNHEKAQATLDQLKVNRDRYIMAGEVLSDIDLMEQMLRNNGS